MSNDSTNNHPPRKKWLVLALIAFGCAAIVGAVGWKAIYPYGKRDCTLKCMYLIFVTYAKEHQGWFPNSTNGPVATLQSLYPDYCPVARELAGISGDVDAVVETLQAAKPLTETLTSWRYVPGLRDDDDPRLAILWEAKFGLYANGRRNSQRSRAVLLIGGDITNVVESGWTTFQKRQETLATAAKQQRKKAQ